MCVLVGGTQKSDSEKHLQPSRFLSQFGHFGHRGGRNCDKRLVAFKHQIQRCDKSVHTHKQTNHMLQEARAPS